MAMRVISLLMAGTKVVLVPVLCMVTNTITMASLCAMMVEVRTDLSGFEV